MTLAVALAPYQGVSLRTARGLIQRGELAAVKVGRAYLVDPADLARVLTPRARAPKPADAATETPTERAHRQLRRAGVAI